MRGRRAAKAIRAGSGGHSHGAAAGARSQRAAARSQSCALAQGEQRPGPPAPCGSLPARPPPQLTAARRCARARARPPPPARSFFDQISQDTGKFVFGVKDTMACLEMGAVETLIVWEDLPITRYQFTNPSTGERRGGTALLRFFRAGPLPARPSPWPASRGTLLFSVWLPVGRSRGGVSRWVEHAGPPCGVAAGRSWPC